MNKWIKILLYGLSVIGIFLVGLAAIVLYYYVPDIPPKELNQKYQVSPAEYKEVNGLKVHYTVAGPASDTLPLVLLHGTGSSLYTWQGWVKELEDQHKIIRLDLPGFGLTGPDPDGDYSVESYLLFLESFLAKLGVEEFVLAGNSLGGEIAWRYALQHPDQVKKLILIGAAGYPINIEYIPLTEVPLSYLLLRIPLLREFSKKCTPPASFRNSLEYLYGKPERITDELVTLYFDMTCREGNREALTERMEAFSQPAPWHQIATIQVPTLVLWGEEDRLIPVVYGKRFHQDMPNSKLVIFPGVGHMPMEEIPIPSARAAKAFLANKDIKQALISTKP